MFRRKQSATWSLVLFLGVLICMFASGSAMAAAKKKTLTVKKNENYNIIISPNIRMDKIEVKALSKSTKFDLVIFGDGNYFPDICYKDVTGKDAVFSYNINSDMPPLDYLGKESKDGKRKLLLSITVKNGKARVTLGKDLKMKKKIQFTAEKVNHEVYRKVTFKKNMKIYDYSKIDKKKWDSYMLSYYLGMKPGAYCIDEDGYKTVFKKQYALEDGSYGKEKIKYSFKEKGYCFINRSSVISLFFQKWRKISNDCVIYYPYEEECDVRKYSK